MLLMSMDVAALNEGSFPTASTTYSTAAACSAVQEPTARGQSHHSHRPGANMAKAPRGPLQSTERVEMPAAPGNGRVYHSLTHI